MNREMRRLQAKEEERAKQRRKQGPAPRKRDRASFQQFFREVRQELKKVAWPGRKELTTFTLVVFITATALTGMTFSLDWGLQKVFLKLLGV